MRALTDIETAILEANGCRCNDWTAVAVADGFSPASYRNVTFIGHIELGLTDGPTTTVDGIPYSPGITNATVKDTRVADNVVISNISGGIAGYDIAPEAVIVGCHAIYCDGTTDFGTGVEASVLDETGSRPIALGPWLTSQLAHGALTDPLFNQRYNAMAGRLAEGCRTTRGRIGARATVSGCQHIHNCHIGPGASLTGVSMLEHTTIDSSADNPATVGTGVIARHCVMLPGSTTGNSSHLTRCLVGEGAIADSLTAHDTLIFANSHLCNGEAAAIFAGPFTVSEHKSTLLIGGTFMMFNAGSGTNQSNHLYKLGPEYFGFTDRGVRAGSGSYILWPARIGAFTTVLGRHYGHPDTTGFPFSYLAEGNGGRSRLIPGIALERISVERDTRKWPSRDARKRCQGGDLVSFDALNPHTIAQIRHALETLRNHPANTDFDADGFYIAAKDIEKGIRRYSQALLRHYGRILATNPATSQATSTSPTGKPSTPAAIDWIDLGGLVTTRHLANTLSEQLCTTNTPGELAEALAQLESSTAALTQAAGIADALAYAGENFDSTDAMLEAYRQAERSHLTALIAEGEAEAQRTGKDFASTPLACQLKAQLADAE